MGLDPDVDMVADNEMFNSLVINEVDRCKVIALEYLKDMPEPVAALPVASDSAGVVRVPGFSQTK